jgi:hypothetical protein
MEVKMEVKMELKVIHAEFSVCKINSIDDVIVEDEYWFLSKTDEELSLVCQTKYAPKDYVEREDGFRAFRIQGVLDFALIGILSKISTVLANEGIGIFAISTFNTDYILVKSENLQKSLISLGKEGYQIVE